MGQKIMQMDPVALADIKSEGYMVVAKAGQNNKVALSEIASDGDIGKIGGSIAPAYDQTATYSVGDLVMYARRLYECTTDISTPEAWDSTHWTRTDIKSIIGDVETLLAAL